MTEYYRNVANGDVHGVQVGTPAHAHCRKGVLLGDFVQVKPTTDGGWEPA